MSSAPEAMPASIGPYRNLELLGRGGMGVVYRGEDLRDGRQVALKTVLLPRAELLRGLRREIQVLARLRHPGIVSILDEGLHEGLPWYAMELLAGLPLSRYRESLTRGPASSLAPGAGKSGSGQWERLDTAASWWTAALDARTGPAGEPSGQGVSAAARRFDTPQPLTPDSRRAVLTLVRHLCKTLAFLHGEGIVHRDLKPDNILLRAASGERRAASEQDRSSRCPPHSSLLTPHSSLLFPVLVDFGLISRFPAELGREAFELAAGSAGTSAYMAPEQIRGDFVDARADLYALGCILYELLTGCRPFEAAEPRELRRAHLEAEPVAPSARDPGVPPALDALVLRLLEKRPEDRLGHAQDVEQALAALGADEVPEAKGWPQPRAYLYRPGLSGRDEVLPALRGHVLDAGAAALVLVGGESGVGKTRLTMELAREALGRGFLVLTGECEPLASAAAGHEAGAAALSALRRPLQEIADWCRERGAAEAGRVFGQSAALLRHYEPAIGTLPGLGPPGPPPALPPAAARRQLFRHLAGTFEALALRQPVLLVLDDLHWADELTLELLGFLAERPRSGAPRLAVLGTYRSDEAGAELRALAEAGGCHALELPRLAEAAIRRMVEQMLALCPAPAALVRSLVQHSEGNPFFVAEYLRSAVAERQLFRDAHGRWQAERCEGLPMPRSLHELIGSRLDGLAQPLRRLIEIAAVAGREVEEPVLAEVAGRNGLDWAEASRGDAVRLWLTEERGQRLRFVHDKLREVAYVEIEPERLSELHGQIAEALETLHGEAAVELAAALGDHRERSGDEPRAMRWYLAGARLAEQRYASAEAERLYRAYLRLQRSVTEEGVEVRGELGRLLGRYGGHRHRAIEEYRRGLDEARALGSRRTEAWLLSRLGHALGTVGHTDESLACHQRALEIARDIGERSIEASALGGVGGHQMRIRQLGECRRSYEQALAIHRELGEREREACDLHNLGICCYFQGRLDETVELLEQSLRLTREIGDRWLEGSNLGRLATLAHEYGDKARALGLYHEALATAREIGDRFEEGRSLANLGLLHRSQGEVEGALRRAEALGAGAEMWRIALVALFERTYLELARGKPAGGLLEAVSARVEGLAHGAGSSFAEPLGCLRRAVAAFEAGVALHAGQCLEDLPPGLLRWRQARQHEPTGRPRAQGASLA
jgi:eukaryotic-like serine/threonine-protein kinase